MRSEFDFPEGADAFEMKEMFESTGRAKVTAFMIRGGKITFIHEEVEPEPEPEDFEASWRAELALSMWDDECKMCGKDRSLNDEGYCSSCWQIWNS